MPTRDAVRMWKFVGAAAGRVPRGGRGLLPGAPMRVRRGSTHAACGPAHIAGNVRRPPTVCAGPRRARRGVRGERARRAAAAAAAGRPLVLRAAHPQAARLGLADPRVPVRGRAVGRIDAAVGGRRPHRSAPAAAPRAPRRGGGTGREHLLPGVRPRQAAAVPPHAAGGQTDVADERRDVDHRGLQPRHRAGRGRGAAARAVAHHPAAAAGGAACVAVVGRARARAGGLHGGAAVADGRTRVEHRAPVPAVRVHRLGRGELGRARDGARAARGGGPGPHVRGGRGGGRARGVADDGAPDRDGRRGLHHGPGAHVAALVGVPHGRWARGHPAGPAQPRGSP